MGGEGEVVFAGDDEVGLLAGGFYEGGVHGACGGEVLVDNRFLGAASFDDVAFDAACEANVWGGVYEDFEVEEVAELGMGENENAFNEDNGNRIELDRFRCTCVQGKVIGGHLDRFAVEKVL